MSEQARPEQGRSFLGHDSRLKRYDRLADMIGDRDNPTPIVALRRVVPEGQAALYLKLEWMNPFGSVKDRPAKWMLEALAARGTLGGRTVIEPTSGNTGIALAAMALLMGVPMTATVPCGMPFEKAVLLEALGAQLLQTPDCTTPGLHPMDEAIDMAAARLTGSDAYVMPNQYENPDNVRAHYETTGPEIWEQTGGQIRTFLAAYGTCGTITGVGRYLKEQDPGIQIVAIEPVVGHHISGLKNLSETSVPGILDRSVVDEVISVDDEETRLTSLRLHAEEALLAGSSTAAIVAGALRYLKGRTGVAVAIAPDSSQKAISYLADALHPRES